MAKTTSRGGKPVGTGAAVTPEERRRMISEAAYYRSQQRGFSGGDSMEDWLVAERDIDARLLRACRQLQPAALPEASARASGSGTAPRSGIPSH